MDAWVPNIILHIYTILLIAELLISEASNRDALSIHVCMYIYMHVCMYICTSVMLAQEVSMFVHLYL